jgi:arginine exporter protein ArgO
MVFLLTFQVELPLGKQSVFVLRDSRRSTFLDDQEDQDSS